MDAATPPAASRTKRGDDKRAESYVYKDKQKAPRAHADLLSIRAIFIPVIKNPNPQIM